MRSAIVGLSHEWEAGGRNPLVKPDDLTVVELCACFLRHAKLYYRLGDGTLTITPHNVNTAIRVVESLYGMVNVGNFTRAALKTCRLHMIEQG